MIIQRQALFIILIDGIVMHRTNSFAEAKAWLRAYNN